MMKTEVTGRNLLHRNGAASLAVVRVDHHGKPDSVSYWKNTGKPETAQPGKAYEPGILVDIWV